MSLFTSEYKRTHCANYQNTYPVLVWAKVLYKSPLLPSKICYVPSAVLSVSYTLSHSTLTTLKTGTTYYWVSSTTEALCDPLYRCRSESKTEVKQSTQGHRAGKGQTQVWRPDLSDSWPHTLSTVLTTGHRPQSPYLQNGVTTSHSAWLRGLS